MSRFLSVVIAVLLGSTAAFAGLHSEATINLIDASSAGLTIQAELPSIAELSASPDFATGTFTFKDDETSVPTITRWMTLPEGTSPVVRVTSSQTRLVNADGTPSDEITRSQFRSNSVWPAEPFSISPVGVYRGTPVAAITFYPLQLTEEGYGIENGSIELSIEFRPDATAPRPTPVRDRPGSRAIRHLDEMLINPPPRDPAEIQSPYLEHILIVYATSIDQLSRPYVDTLAVWKRQMGYKVTIWPVDLGQMNALQIRDTIRTTYYAEAEYPIDHLIIMGGDSLASTPYFPPEQNKGDHYYSLMDDGDELISDITVGRMYALSSTDFRGVIKRSVRYEREPFLQGGNAWFKRALYTAENIAAPGGQFVPSMIQLGRWIWHRWDQMGYEPIDTLYTGGDPEDAQQVRVLVQDILRNEGVSIAISRGWLYGCLVEDDVPVRTNRRNPFVSAITCLSSGVQSDFFRLTDRATCDGPIADLAIWGLTHSKTNNCLMGGQVRAMYQVGMTQPGYIMNYSKFQLATDYRMAEENLEEVRLLLYAYRLMGDPTVDVFTDTPTAIRAAHLGTLTPGTTAFDIDVTKDGEVLPDAVVAIRQGNQSWVASPGDDGTARFIFPDGLEEGTVTVAVTHHNSVPYFASVPVSMQNADLFMSGHELSGPHEDYRAGDTLEASVLIANLSDSQVSDINVAFSSESDWVSFDPVARDIGDISSGADLEFNFDIVLDRSTPDAEPVQVNLTLTSGERVWHESFEFNVSAANIVLTGMAFGPGDRFERDRECRILPPLRNEGSIGSVILDGELVSLNPELFVVTGANAWYNAANPDARLTLNGQFTVHLDPTAVPGTEALFDLRLRARNDDSFRDTIRISIPVGRRTATDPSGPDAYGYYCFDSFDQSWSKVPTFGWREINPSADNPEFEGQNLHMEDWEEDDDKSSVVELPFPFTYYGEEFTHLTVCTNGWVAFGADKSIFVDFRNTQIPGVLGPDAQLAVMWDDFVITADWDNRGVFVHYVENESIFIVEWSKMQVFRDNTGTAQEFQLILKDPEAWPTRSGDGEIIYQYKTFNAAEGNFTDNKYSTIGIKNLDGTDGIQYTYWNQYFEEQGARRIDNGTALLFTTDFDLSWGSVSGRVSRFENDNEALSGVTVTIPGVATTLSSAQGTFELPNVPVGQYTCTFSKVGFNQGRVAIEVLENENTVANARLTHPVADIAQESLSAWLDPGDETGHWDLNVANGGNGELDFHLALRYSDGSAPTLPQRMETPISRLYQGNSNFHGLEIIGDNIFITSSGDPNNPVPDDNYIIILNRQGNEVARFRQPAITGNGFRDLAFDGTYLWGGEDSMVVQFDLQGNRIRSIRVPVYQFNGNQDSLAQPAALAWNREDSTLLMAYRNSPIYEMNMAGEIVGIHRFTLPRQVPDIYGLAWNEGDPDGMPVYAMIRNSPDGREVSLAKTNFAESKVVKQLSTYNGQRGSGLAIGFDWERFKTVVATATSDAQDGTDTLKVFELGPDTRGVNFNRGMLHVPPGLTLSVPIQFSSKGMLNGEYRYSFVTFHNALSDSIVTPVIFEIRPGAGVSDPDLVPSELELEAAYPNPFNNVTRFSFALPQAGTARLTIYDIDGRTIATVVHERLEAGRHTALFNAGELSSGVYFARLDAAGTSRTVRTVLLK